MILYPAIDLKDGQCVRLRQGRMEDATAFSNDPAAQAKIFADAGCEWLHLVDLNGAFEGKPVNGEAVASIIRNLRNGAATEQGEARSVGFGEDSPTPEGQKIKIQLGGGIRDLATIAMWLDAGISRVILGTIAVKNPQLVKDACKQFPGHIAVGIDTKDGMAAVSGWAEASEISGLELAQRFEDAGVSTIIYTDIARDGEMQGPNLEATVALAEAVSIPVIVSGGVSSLDDLRRIRQYPRLNGAIIGRALYEGMDILAARAILES